MYTGNLKSLFAEWPIDLWTI